VPGAREAIEKLCRIYWYPIYGYIRQHSPTAHDAQDLTQEFFSLLLEKNYLGAVDRKKGKFRSFLLVAINRFLINARKRAHAAKRGGGKTIISLDEEEAERRFAAEPATPESPDKLFDRRWAQTLLDRVLDRLGDEYVLAGKTAVFNELRPFLLDEASSGDYPLSGARLNMKAGTVAVAVHRLRERYRELLREEITPTIADAGDTEREMQHILRSFSA
jgi:RNA polymerase sigma-70 factor (ECF subfamily)